MMLNELKAQVALDEDSRRQFKQDMQSPDALAAEMAAFANSEGGVIFLGVADGLPARTQLCGCIATQPPERRRNENWRLLPTSVCWVRVSRLPGFCLPRWIPHGCC
jgi:predicted HTH transcriptional regulator